MSVEAHQVVPVRSSRSASAAVHRHARSTWAAVVVGAIALLWTVPTVGLLVTSLRPVQLTKYTGWWEAVSDRTLTLDNYVEVIQGGQIIPGGISPYLANTVAIVIPATVIPIVLAAMAAYALAWIPFRGSAVILGVVVALQVLPIQMALLPLLALFSNGWSLGPIPTFPNLDDPVTGQSLLMGTYVPLWMAHTAFALPLAVFLMFNAIARVPRELMDAARIDGAGHALIFRRLVLPLAAPAIAAFAIFQFLWVWNDLLVAISFAGGSPDVAPITAYLANIQGGYGVHMHLVTAGAFIAIIIPLVVFFVLQRYFVRGILAGAVDG